MKNITGFYPRTHVDTAASGAVGPAGAVLLAETVTGLASALSAALASWRKPLAVHNPAKVICDLAATLAVGGHSLCDIGMLRAETGLNGRVASDATVSRTISALAKDAPAALNGINTGPRRREDACVGTGRSHAPTTAGTRGIPWSSISTPPSSPPTARRSS